MAGTTGEEPEEEDNTVSTMERRKRRFVLFARHLLRP